MATKEQQSRWVSSHRTQYNVYMKQLMQKRRLWDKIRFEFFNILLTEN